MAPPCIAQIPRKSGFGRKRAFPTPSRHTWRIVYAVTLSASVVATIAFQQSLPISFCHSLSPLPRSSTAAFVLMEPMNLVTIESKQSLEHRVALEELYLLSSLAKKATRKKKPATQKTRRKPKISPPFIDDNTQKQSTSKFPVTTRSNFIEIHEDTLDEGLLNTAIENHRSRRILEKKNISKATERTSSHVTTRGRRHNPSKYSAPISKLSKIVEDKESELDDFVKKTRAKSFLTTVPNRRNKKKKKTPVECNPIDQDEYIRSILQKKEIDFSHDFQSSSNEFVKRSRHVDISEEIDFKVSNLRSKPLNMVYSSRSSTMPGFREGKKKLRNKEYSDGIEVATKNSRIDLLEPKNDRGQSMYMTSNSVPDSLVQFANEIHTVDRITPEEEIMLGEKTQEALRLQHIYDGLLAKLEREPTDDEWCAAAGKFNMEAIAQIIDEGLEAKNKLVTSNLRMVQGVVNVYIRNGLQGNYNAGDLMQEGILALMRAAEKFDPSRGFRFSTYAMYWIRSAIKRDQLSQSRIIRVPQRLHENYKKIIVNRTKLTEMLYRQPTQVELSKELGMTVQQIERCETAFSQRMHSLDQSMVNRHNPSNLGDKKESLVSIIATKSDENEYDEMDLIHLREDLFRALKFHLTQEEANILILRFGMDDDYASSKKIGRSIIEVGRMVGLKPDKVRRIIKRSLKQLESTIGDEFQLYNRDFCI